MTAKPKRARKAMERLMWVDPELFNNVAFEVHAVRPLDYGADGKNIYRRVIVREVQPRARRKK